MESLLEATGQYTPSVVKSCSRCRGRKVKVCSPQELRIPYSNRCGIVDIYQCDLKIPQCSACERHGEACNITEFVAYPYSVVEKLHARVQELEQRLHASQSTNQVPSITQNLRAIQQSPTGAWSADVTREAEEVGVLAIGFQDPYSQGKYGRKCPLLILKYQISLTCDYSGRCGRIYICSHFFQTNWPRHLFEFRQ